MNNIKQFLYFMIGRVPADIHNLNIEGKTLLHISDTPVSFFGELKRIINVLKPDYIVHTGDLVDNIKLQLLPGAIGRYEHHARQLIKLLEQSDAKKIFLALGNHDDKQTIEKLCNRSHIIAEFQTVDIEGLKITIAHDPLNIHKQPAACNLYGHNLTQRSGFSDGRLYLNGISSINLLELNTMNYHSFPYPYGIDNDRLGIGKIGL